MLSETCSRRFKDYIAMPKSNLSISPYHSRVVTVNRWRFKPHQGDASDRGVRDCRHWQYKEGKNPSDKALLDKIAWIRHLLNGRRTEDVDGT